MASAQPIPQGYTTVTPSITLNDAPKAIEFYKKALGATERMRMPGPDGKIMHAEIQIGNAIIMMNDEAGGKQLMPVTDMFWGDRMGYFEDPFGYTWNVATHVKDVTPEEMKKGQEEFMKQMAGAR